MRSTGTYWPDCSRSWPQPRQQYDLLEAADRGEVPADVYQERFTTLLRRTVAELDRVLPRAAFERVFGAAPDDALGIVDPEVYARVHELPRRP